MGLTGEDGLHVPDEGVEGGTPAASSRDRVGGSISSQCVTEHLESSAWRQASGGVISAWEYEADCFGNGSFCSGRETDNIGGESVGPSCGECDW